MEDTTNLRRCFSEDELAYIAESIQNGCKSSLPLDLLNHLSCCDSCASELLIILETTESRSKHRDLNINKKSLILTITFSSVAALFGAGLFIFHIIVNTNTSTKSALKTDSKENIAISDNSKTKTTTPNLPKTTFIGKSEQKPTTSLTQFEPNSDLEKLILRNTIALRGSKTSFTVIENTLNTPPVKINITDQNTQEFQLLILDNKNQLVKETTFCCKEFIIPKLEKGLFYFKILNTDDDLLYVGKIRSN